MFQISISILDMLFIQGNIVILSTALAVLSYLEDHILFCQDFCKFFWLLIENRIALSFNGYLP